MPDQRNMLDQQNDAPIPAVGAAGSSHKQKIQ